MLPKEILLLLLQKRLADELKALGKNEGFTATAAAAKITITAKDYQNWNVVAGDKLFGATVTVNTKGVAPIKMMHS